MRFLFCCEFYHPSVGGVQEVMRQIAERLVQRGHEVTVATTAISERGPKLHNGVKIEDFYIAGNLATGLKGEVERYQRFVSEFGADALLIKAAQQWTFDALWPVLQKISTRKVFIPCGFSGLFDSKYQEYYESMKEVLPFVDHFIFYTEEYRDVEYVRGLGLNNFSIIPNGACEKEFEHECELIDIRSELGIGQNEFLFLSVGSLTSIKGHIETAEAYAKFDGKGRPSTLLINGNKIQMAQSLQPSSPIQIACRALLDAFMVLMQIGMYSAIKRIYARLTGGSKGGVEEQIKYWSGVVSSLPGKRIILTDLSRDRVIEAYKAADLFIFASNTEYSPLVLYEAAAAGTPFITVPVGNSVEIARLTGAGTVCDAQIDSRGFTHVVPACLAQAMNDAVNDPVRLKQMGRTGRENWQKKFTWKIITDKYLEVLCRVDND